MRRAVPAAVALALLSAAPAGAVGVAGYDGTFPFNCVLQQAGTGTTIPEPGADPLCVEYDKTQQNVSELGIVGFLLGEPDRFAMAGDKCFYMQHDHWRSSVEQGWEQSEGYNWDGTYFLDRARGVGGAYVENFTVNNVSFDPRSLPGFPPQWEPYFSYGRGGVQVTDSVPIEPRCVEKAAREDVYARPSGGAGAGDGDPPPPPRERRRGLRLHLDHASGDDARGRPCSPGDVRARVTGRATRGLRRVDFRVRGRRVARDRRRPFSRRIAGRHLRRGEPTRIVARARHRDGRTTALSARVRRCA